MYNYAYVIQQNSAKINTTEQSQCICKILRFSRSYNIINVIIEQFLHNSLQFVANAYQDNKINEWHYTYWQVTVDCINHIQRGGLHKGVANYSSCDLYVY